MYEKSYTDNVLKRETKKSNKKNSFSWRRALIVSIILTLIAGLTLLIRLPYFQIKEIKIEGTKSVFPEDVKDLVLSHLEGNYLFLYPKSSLFLLPDAFLEKDLKREFTRFRVVKVKRAGHDSISIRVQEYERYYLWCETSESCDFMSREGVVFPASSFFSGDAIVKIFVGERGSYPFSPIGKDELAMVEKLSRRLQDINISPAEFHFKRDANNKLIVIFYHNDYPTEIRFDTTLSMDMGLDAFYATLRDANFNRRFRDKTLKLLYVDLMLPSKVTYNFK